MRLALPLVLAGALLATAGCNGFREGLARGQAAVMERELSETAANLNNNLPRLVDKATQLDRAEALPGKVLQYDCTLVGVEAGQLDRETFDRIMKASRLNLLRTSPDLAPLRNLGVTFIYPYRDKAGTPVGRYPFGANAYKG